MAHLYAGELRHTTLTDDAASHHVPAAIRWYVLAILTEAPRDSVTLWGLAADLALLCGLHVDLLDLRAASTVMQYQVITTGERIWASDSSAALYESFILSEKTSLDEARAGLLQDIASRGTVHG